MTRSMRRTIAEGVTAEMIVRRNGDVEYIVRVYSTTIGQVSKVGPEAWGWTPIGPGWTPPADRVATTRQAAIDALVNLVTRQPNPTEQGPT